MSFSSRRERDREYPERAELAALLERRSGKTEAARQMAEFERESAKKSEGGRLLFWRMKYQSLAFTSEERQAKAHEWQASFHDLYVTKRKSRLATSRLISLPPSKLLGLPFSEARRQLTEENRSPGLAVFHGRYSDGLMVEVEYSERADPEGERSTLESMNRTPRRTSREAGSLPSSTHFDFGFIPITDVTLGLKRLGFGNPPKGARLVAKQGTATYLEFPQLSPRSQHVCWMNPYMLVISTERHAPAPRESGRPAATNERE